MATERLEPAFEQPDLFSGPVSAPPPEAAVEWIDWAPIDPSRLSDTALIEVLPRARQAEAPGLASEAARRGLAGAVPALEALCQRFRGFGLDREITEQAAALRGLASIGGATAADAVTRLIVSKSIQGPGIRVALEAASGLGCRLPADRIISFLRDDDPAVREAACRCARTAPAVVAALIDLLADLHASVSQAAALALARAGHREGNVILLRLLGTAPSEEVIRAIASIARDDEWVLLGQTALRRPDLAGVVLEVLEDCEEPRAAAVAKGLRRRSGIGG